MAKRISEQREEGGSSSHEREAWEEGGGGGLFLQRRIKEVLGGGEGAKGANRSLSGATRDLTIAGRWID